MQNIQQHHKFFIPLLPCIYNKPDDGIKESLNGKIKVSVRKLLKSLAQGNGSIVLV